MLQMNPKLVLVFVTVSFVISIWCISVLSWIVRQIWSSYMFVVSSGSPKYSRVHAEIF
jgi:uncharacterized ion transporter superfamily protein YfcC